MNGSFENMMGLCLPDLDPAATMLAARREAAVAAP